MGSFRILLVFASAILVQPGSQPSTAPESPPAAPSDHPQSADDRDLPYYHYFKERRVLDLNTTLIAVHSAMPDFVAAKKADSTRLQIKSVRRHSISGWHLLELESDAASIMDVRDSVEQLTNDDQLDFVSPVFRDAMEGESFCTPDILIGFVNSVTHEQATSLLHKHGLTEIRDRDWANMPGVYRVRASHSNGFTALDAANSLATQDGVTFAEPDMVFSGRGDLIPNDPRFVELWGLQNTGLLGGTPGMDMSAPAAWDISIGDPAIKVVVIDTGIQQDHPDLNQIVGADFTGQGGSGGPINPCDNHGTAVAGCVSATIDNMFGITGIAPACPVVSARPFISLLPCTGHWEAQASWTVDALAWAESIGARVTNNGNGYGFTSAAIATKYASSRTNGIIHFASAGNDALGSVTYPSSLESVNAVAALNRNGGLASFSNHGPALSLSAPGASIVTTDRTGADGWAAGDFAYVDGTSFASPYAAGVAALVLSEDPGLTAEDVEWILRLSARDLGDPGIDSTFGGGFVDALQALILADQDCDNDAIPDFLELSGNDCNSNHLPDECDQVISDCNANGVDDALETCSGRTIDVDNNGIPDICESVVLFVDAAATGQNTGTSWSDAFVDLQAALDIARLNPLGLTAEIWVAEGAYAPDSGTGDRFASFHLAPSVALYGGFAGYETTREERVPEVNVTTLSGDLLANDTGDDATLNDNSLHVLQVGDCDSATIVDGFTIQSGRANMGVQKDARGAGVWLELGQPVFRHCRFVENTCTSNGGAIRIEQGANPTFEFCEFRSNSCGLSGGAVQIAEASGQFSSCEWRDNSANSQAGALQCSNSNAVRIVGSEFIGNTSIGLGGAVAATNVDMRFDECLFTQNVSMGSDSLNGGGGAVVGSGVIAFENSEFISNSTQRGAGGAAWLGIGGSYDFRGCRFDDNSAISTGGAIQISGQLKMTDCVLTNNRAARGGALRSSGEATMRRCRLEQNATVFDSGAILVDGVSSLDIADCLIAGNTANGAAGLSVTSIVELTIVNCTITENAGGNGVGGIQTNSFNSVIRNTILWSNSGALAPDIRDVTDSAIVEYSCVTGGWPGVGNTSADPLFVDALAADFRPGAGSPVIDAGNNDHVPPPGFYDLGLSLRRFDDPATDDSGQGASPVVDMGAYEFIDSPICRGDLNGDGQVNGIDIHMFVSCLFGANPSCLLSDMDVDGIPADMDANDDTAAFVATLLSGNACP